ncbi:MAG: glycosyltransferase family 2 protein [Flavobacteriia bacterium]|jgi:glycosyltransferase involved in cell wall biosynthesis
MKIGIIITGYNCQDYAKQCIESALNQTYKDIKVMVYNDASTDDTKSIIENYKDSCEIFNSKTNNGALYGRYHFVNKTDCDVVCFLGLDDMLASNAIQIIANAYSDEKILSTYGSWVSITDGTAYIAQPYSDDVFFNKSFRHTAWKATALNTFKTSLIKKVPKDVLLDIDGEFYKNCTDLAYSFPCLDMMNKENVKVIIDIIYLYRSQHENTTLKRFGKANKSEIKERLKQKKIVTLNKNITIWK